MNNTKTAHRLAEVAIAETGIPFSPDPNGFLKQIAPQHFDYTLEYKAKQSTNAQMDWLRLGWLSAYIPYSTLKGFNAVDIGAGNGSFVKEAGKVFRRIVPYDLVGDSVTDKELYQTEWDLIVMSDVIEHYLDIDDLWNIQFRYALISFPETPHGTDLRLWRHYKPNEHIYMLDRESFTNWVKAHGCQIINSGCPEDFIRTRWDADRINISTFLLNRRP